MFFATLLSVEHIDLTRFDIIRNQNASLQSFDVVLVGSWKRHPCQNELRQSQTYRLLNKCQCRRGKRCHRCCIPGCMRLVQLRLSIPMSTENPLNGQSLLAQQTDVNVSSGFYSLNCLMATC